MFPPSLAAVARTGQAGGQAKPAGQAAASQPSTYVIASRHRHNGAVLYGRK